MPEPIVCKPRIVESHAMSFAVNFSIKYHFFTNFTALKTHLPRNFEKCRVHPNHLKNCWSRQFTNAVHDELEIKNPTKKRFDWLDDSLRDELLRKRRYSCRLSHQNLLLHIYNNLPTDLIINLANKIIAPYQALCKPVSKTRKAIYLHRFTTILCESLKHKSNIDETDKSRVYNIIYISKMYLNCMDILTSRDMLNMLTTRSILKHGFNNQKYSNFEHFIANFNKKPQDSETQQLTTFHKKDLVIKKTTSSEPIKPKIYECLVKWFDKFEDINVDNMAFVLNLPYVREPQLSTTLHKTISHFGEIHSLKIFNDRISPFDDKVDLNHKGKLPPGKDYSQLYALVQFVNNENKLRFCDTAVRCFGTIYNGRLIYSEFAERKTTLTLVIYPPFHTLRDAFEEIANGLTHSAISSTRTRKTKSSGVNDIDHCTILCYEEDIIVKSSKKYIRKERINGCISELQPQCILLKFPSFQLAYIAKSRLERYLSLQWPSFISFDTYRCTLHNGRWVDGPRIIHSNVKTTQNF